VNDCVGGEAVYDKSKPVAKSRGVKRQKLLKKLGPPNELVILSEFEEMGKVK
jgi:hypothetical protein